MEHERLNNSVGSPTDNAKEHDLFIIRNDDIDAHVTSDELKSKLRQFKQQLELVKAIYKKRCEGLGDQKDRNNRNVAENNGILPNRTILQNSFNSKENECEDANLIRVANSVSLKESMSKVTSNEMILENGRTIIIMGNKLNENVPQSCSQSCLSQHITTSILPNKIHSQKRLEDIDLNSQQQSSSNHTELKNSLAADATVNTFYHSDKFNDSRTIDALQNDTILKAKENSKSSDFCTPLKNSLLSIPPDTIEPVEDRDTIYRDCSGEGRAVVEHSDIRLNSYPSDYNNNQINVLSLQFMEQLKANIFLNHSPIGELCREPKEIDPVSTRPEKVEIDNTQTRGRSKRQSSLPKPVRKATSNIPIPRKTSSKSPRRHNSELVDGQRPLTAPVTRRAPHRKDSEVSLLTSDPECDGNQPRNSRHNRNLKESKKNENSEEINQLKEKYEQKLCTLRRDLHIESEEKSKLSLQLKYFYQLNNELVIKCNNYERKLHHIDTEKKVIADESLILKEKQLKLQFENLNLNSCYEDLKSQKSIIENELLKSQKMVNESLQLRQETEQCLLEIRKTESSATFELNHSKSMNQALRAEVETLKRMCQENNEELKSHQISEVQLRLSLEKANNKIRDLEIVMKEKEMTSEFALKKLQESYEKLEKEHETVKILYAESIRKIQELLNEIEDLKRYHSTINGLHRNRSLNRKTWFSHHLIDKQFKYPDLGLSDAKDDKNNSKINITSQRTFKQEFLRSRSYDDSQFDCLTDGYVSTKTHDVEAGSVRSATLSVSPNSYCYSRSQSVASSNNNQPEVLYEPHDLQKHLLQSFSHEDNNRDGQSCNSINSYDSDACESFDTDGSVTKNNVPFSRLKEPRTNINSSYTSPNEIPLMKVEDFPIQRNSWYIPVNESIQTSKIPSLLKKTPQRLSQTASKIPSRSVSKSTDKSINQKNPQPFSKLLKSKRSTFDTKSKLALQTIVIPRVTTDEALATVNQCLLERKSPKLNNYDETSPLSKLKNCHGNDDAEAIMNLEERLNCLNAEKEKLDSQLGRIPTRGSGRFNRQMAQQETRLQDRYDLVMNELATVRMELRKYKLL